MHIGHTLRSLRRFSLLGLMLIVMHFALVFVGASFVSHAMTDFEPRIGFSGIAGAWQVIMFVGITIMTVCYAIVGGSQLGLALESRSWPVVQGTILKCKPDQRELKTKYSYIVAEKSYQGDTTSFGHTARDSPKQRLRFAEGTNVDVFYDPAYPAVSCLIPGIAKFPTRVLGTILLCPVLGAMCVYVGLHALS